MEYCEDTYLVTRKDGSTLPITIFYDEGLNKYRYVVTTTNRICSQQFASREEAIKDLDKKVKSKKILGYKKVS